MSRRAIATSPHALRVSGDRWLFGYADIVTLLFACFATLYVTTLTPAEATPATSATVAVEPPVPSRPADPPVDLVALLTGALSLPGVESATTVRGFVMSLPEAGSFPAGSDTLSPEVTRAMRRLAERLALIPNQIRVEGHTDDRPIATRAFRSNWELSTARATRVIELLVGEGISPSRLSAAGYGEFRPLVPNISADARARNRRVDIVVLDPTVARLEEPGAVPQ
jgi:chemotaxis protein MotB